MNLWINITFVLRTCVNYHFNNRAYFTNMRKNLFIILATSLLSCSLNSVGAQSELPKTEKKPYLSWELGLLAGGSMSQNDMVNVGLKEVRPAGSFFIRKNIAKTLAIRASVVSGSISGNDKNTDSHVNRGFFFDSPMREFSLMAEYDFTGEKRYKDSGFEQTWSPYIGIGAGLCITQPNNTFYNETQNSKLGTQIAQDKLNAKDKNNRFFTTPVVLGLKRDINERLLFHAEIGLRLIYNDYLDGVSLAGNPSKNDTYAFGAMGISLRLGGGEKE